MYNLKNNQSIIIKEVHHKDSAVVIWDKKDYLIEAKKNSFHVKKLMKKFQVRLLFSLKVLMILLKKFEEEGTFLVIFQIVSM